jgi:hypothetical protein
MDAIAGHDVVLDAGVGEHHPQQLHQLYGDQDGPDARLRVSPA